MESLAQVVSLIQVFALLVHLSHGVYEMFAKVNKRQKLTKNAAPSKENMGLVLMCTIEYNLLIRKL